ncbi:MAG: TPM domain-containing protein, partial [Sphingobacteriales bacterium]
LDMSGRAHIDVVVVESIGEAVPKDAATELFRKWKIGAKETNNGLLILVVNDQHRIEFETGYGLEGDLPDITCYHIQQQYMVPHAKNNDLDLAVREGVAATIRQLQTGQLQQANNADSVLTDTAVAADLATVDQTHDSVITADVVPFVSEDYNTVIQQEPQGGVVTIIMMVIYLVLTIIIDNQIWGKRIKYRVFSPLFWLTFLIPVLGVVYLNWFHPTEWYDTRAAFVLYASLSCYLSLYFPLAGLSLKRKLKGKTRYEQYVMLEEAHYKMAWARYVFPLPYLLFYWQKYTRKTDHLRNDPYPCETCGKDMKKLAETDDDEYLEKGNIAEEIAKSVDYDVWACADNSHEKLVLVYKNLSTKAIKCPKCEYLTLMPDGKKEVVAATTSSEGWGWILKRCHFCDHREQEQYTIPKISTSSSSSFSSSSGGSSGGGGAGSSW